MQDHLRHCIVAVALLCAPAANAATQICPWLNAATAAGILEGSVTVSVSYSDQHKTDGVCEFTHKADHAVRTLRIEVDSMTDRTQEFPRYFARCGEDAKPVKAIGNEAAACSSTGTKNQIAEQVVSRVRDRAFVVGVSSTGSALKRDVIRDKAQKVAQQVAGILF